MRILTALILGVLCVSGYAVESPTYSQTVILVVGEPGAAEYGQEFAESARLWQQACAKGQVQCVTIGLDEQPDSSDRKKLKEVLAGEAEESTAALWLVLMGHGTFDGRAAKFNLRGPDISAEDLGEWFKPLSRPVVLINAASSSAPFLADLSAPGRVIVTATKSGFEQSYARFGRYLAEAIAEAKADLDKDGQTSLLEAFLTAASRTVEFYAGEGRLATEHALLDDNGDGLGTRADWFRGIRPIQKAADGASLDGYRAHQLHIVRSETEASMAPETRADRDRLELEVMALRDAKETLAEEEYYSRIEALLRKIAELYEQTDTSRDQN